METIKIDSREKYLNAQIACSVKKFKYCKVSMDCVLRFKEIITRSKPKEFAPILCLGVRNGRELDLFRIGFFGKLSRIILVKLLEIRKDGFISLFKAIEYFGRSDVNNIDNRSVVGVELNPQCKRKDVLNISFDELPAEWKGKFKIVYTNSIDHCQDIHKTAKGWMDVIQPQGYIIIGNGAAGNTSEVGLVGNVIMEDILQLFPGELIYYNRYGNRYADVIIRKKS